LLTLDEAAELLGRLREHVERAIVAGFLRVRRKGTRCYTVQACRTFLDEERADLDAAHAAVHPCGGRVPPDR
jgi:hypothetical protein